MASHDCQSIENESAFLWCVLYYYFVKHFKDEAIGLACSMYEQKFDFSPEFEYLIAKLCETNDAKFFFRVAEAVVRQQLFCIEKHILIVAILIEEGEINISDAALLLKVEIPYDYKKLDAKFKNVIDVVWLVNEDMKDGIMSPTDDNILLDALKAVRRIRR